MQNDLKNLLKLLEKSFNTHDSSELQSLEKEIDEISSNIKNTISSSENIDYQLNKDDIEKLEILIKKYLQNKRIKKNFYLIFKIL